MLSIIEFYSEEKGPMYMSSSTIYKIEDMINAWPKGYYIKSRKVLRIMGSYKT